MSVATLDPDDDWTERQFVAYLRAGLERTGVVVEMSDAELAEHAEAYQRWRAQGVGDD